MLSSETVLFMMSDMCVRRLLLLGRLVGLLRFMIQDLARSFVQVLNGS